MDLGVRRNDDFSLCHVEFEMPLGHAHENILWVWGYMILAGDRVLRLFSE